MVLREGVYEGDEEGEMVMRVCRWCCVKVFMKEKVMRLG